MEKIYVGVFGNFYTKVFEPEVDICACMHNHCQDGVRMCTLRPRASAQLAGTGGVSGFRNMRTTHRLIYIYTIGTLCLHVGDSRKFSGEKTFHAHFFYLSGVLCLLRAIYHMIPSEMEVALRYNCITLDTVHTVYTVFILLFFKVSMGKTNRLRVGG